MEKVKKEASDAEKLEKKKKTYQAKLDNLVKNVTDSELKTTLSKIVDSAKADISNATSEEQMNEILTKAKNDIPKASLLIQSKALSIASVVPTSYLRFWLSSCRTSLAVSALRIMRYLSRTGETV